MLSYSMHIKGISDILNRFITDKRIDAEKSEKTITDNIRFLIKKQFEILNSQMPEYKQSILFNALRNTIVIMREMKIELASAFERNENPTTAERCYQLIPFMLDLSNDLDEFEKNKEEKVMEMIDKNTRILRRKARNFSFLKTIEQEMEDVNLSKTEIEDFVEKFNKSIEITLATN